MSRNILSSILNTQDLISLRIRNLNSEFIFNGHDNLHGIEGIKSEVINKFGSGCDLCWVYFVEVFNYGYDTVGYFRGIEEGLWIMIMIVVVGSGRETGKRV
jgi:hypothetical protein